MPKATATQQAEGSKPTAQFGFISKSIQHTLESARSLPGIKDCTMKILYDVLSELHQSSGDNESIYKDIIEEPTFTVIESQTHNCFGLNLRNVTGEDERPASSTNFAYCWVHGTTEGGAGAILRSRQVFKSHEDPTSGYGASTA